MKDELSQSIKRKLTGFSIIELLITLCLMITLTLCALPTMSAMVENWSLEKDTRAILHLFQRSKAKAAQLGRSIVICGVSGSQGDYQCQRDWERKIVAFVDVGGDGHFSKEDRVVYALRPTASRGGTTLKANRKQFKIRANGTLKSTPGSVFFCSLENPASSKRLVVDRIGRARLTRFDRENQSVNSC